jgi:hypothetical protein
MQRTELPNSEAAMLGQYWPPGPRVVHSVFWT